MDSIVSDKKVPKSAQNVLGRLLCGWRTSAVKKEVKGRLLDIACGDNTLAIACGNNAVGVDIVDYGTADHVVESLSTLPFPDGSFDSVAIVASLNYFDGQEEVLRECCRLLKDDGRLIVTMISPALGRIWHMLREPWAKRPGISSRRVESMALEAGFALAYHKRFMLQMNNMYVFRKTPSPVFIVSTGRTGTRFLADFFSQFGKDVESHHTTSFTRLLNILGNMTAVRIVPRSFLRSTLKSLKYRNIVAAAGRYIECNPYYYTMLDALSDMFPGATTVHVVRSPRSFVASHIRWERSRLKSRVANTLVPFWEPVGYFRQLEGLFRNYYRRVEFYADIWRIKNARIMDQLRNNERSMVVRFEDLFDSYSGKTELVNVMKALGLEARTEIPEDVIAHPLNQSAAVGQNVWDRRCSEIISERCGDIMKELGYGDQPSE